MPSRLVFARVVHRGFFAVSLVDIFHKMGLCPQVQVPLAGTSMKLVSYLLCAYRHSLIDSLVRMSVVVRTVCIFFRFFMSG